ncbi:MAG: hypothetical protein U1F25_03925 [Rubrivivax sp.]
MGTSTHIAAKAASAKWSAESVARGCGRLAHCVGEQHQEVGAVQAVEVDAVEVREGALDLVRLHASRVHRDGIVVEVREAPRVLGVSASSTCTSRANVNRH